ncbi:MAG: hypothetical protein IPG90_17805 [Bacteroidetes bacterium]|nr:hypothetical protein [Bacteroidota bacterium]
MHHREGDDKRRNQPSTNVEMAALEGETFFCMKRTLTPRESVMPTYRGKIEETNKVKA